jgi:chromosomal replication initiation ATPase DnaA
MTNTTYPKRHPELTEDHKIMIKICNAVCKFWNVSAKDMIFEPENDTEAYRPRNTMMVKSRWMSIFLIKKHSDMVMPDIATFFLRSHTTVAKANKAIKEGNPSIQESIKRIEKILGFPHDERKTQKSVNKV